MAADERDSDKPFKVQDRRRFLATGDARPDVEDTEPSRPAAPSPEAAGATDPAATAGSDQPTGKPGQPAAHAHEHDTPVELNFATFLISLSTQALAMLGEIPDPVSGQTHVDLAGARQFIDILAILGEKTRGNLDAHESALLQGALYDLRMKFVERSSGR